MNLEKLKTISIIVACFTVTGIVVLGGSVIIFMATRGIGGMD